VPVKPNFILRRESESEAWRDNVYAFTPARREETSNESHFADPHVAKVVVPVVEELVAPWVYRACFNYGEKSERDE
jgi:hypothetical protein